MQMAAEAQRHWKEPEDVITGILQGHEFNQEKFIDAVDFFQALTGIPSHDSGTYIGRIPNEQLRKDLEAWSAWYSENGPHLRWNPATGRVEVDLEAKAAAQRSSGSS